MPRERLERRAASSAPRAERSPPGALSPRAERSPRGARRAGSGAPGAARRSVGAPARSPKWPRHRASALLSLLAAALAGCGGAALDPGLGAWLRVSGAQYVPGAVSPTAFGPQVLALNVSRSAAARGDSALHVSGSLAPTANAVALWLEGDRGFWLLPAGLPDVTIPDALSFAVTVALARDAPLGPRQLQVAALSGQAVAGPVSAAALEVLAVPEPTGTLVVSLAWDTDADLDLHVVDGNGVEIWARNPNSWLPVAGAPPDPNAWKQGGLLDADSNARCVIDGRDQENVVWQATPPSGHYLVRVDTFSLCGQAGARWTVEARLEGKLVASAAGAATEASTRPPHDLGAGVLAAEFDVP
jgi:hypothetical protein